jgi:riboflavin synthase
MFTGLIREIGTLQAARRQGDLVRLEIEAPRTAATLAVGDSVAVNGICLTVTRCAGRVFAVEAVGETRRLTTLGTWRSGRRLHLEPALRVGDPLDGHLMQGHVDGLGTVARMTGKGGGLALTIKAAAAQRQFLTPKGSVAVDGVSLTVDEGPFDAGFTVHLIPHTVGATHFAGLRAGDRVNLEMDVLVKAARSGDFTRLPRVQAAPTITRRLTLADLLAKGFARPRSG